MLWLDRWTEVAEALGRNRLRTGLTALSVAWGVFMLVALLGIGGGIANNIYWQFRDDAINSLWIYPGATSVPHAGYGVGRPVRLTDADYEMLRDNVPGIEHIAGRFRLRGEFTIRRGPYTAAYDIRSVHPDHQHIEKTIIRAGRFLNDLDLAERRKVTVIGTRVAEFLFPDRAPLEGPIGEQITINAIPYTVVGVFEDVGGENELRKVYIPITTARLAYGGGDQIHQLLFTVGDATLAESQAIEQDVRQRLAARHNYDAADRRALRVRNNLESFAEVQQIFTWLNGFIWLVGLGTVAAGIVGVGNISLISVTERTKEIGLRKALGAPPGAIVGQVVRESVALTATSGYIGLLGGVALIEGMRAWLPENDYIRDPDIALEPALLTAAVLVLAGALAGYIPARRAASVPPVVALRDD